MRLLAAYVRTSRCMCSRIHVLQAILPAIPCAMVSEYRCSSEHNTSFHQGTQTSVSSCSIAATRARKGSHSKCCTDVSQNFKLTHMQMIACLTQLSRSKTLTLSHRLS